ncbi:hypothetical protein [Psychrobacillus vulpis]|uniref:hypothetical protein n=1 Tax=Psychrobacillus vulpis TaxID=2325572 RepID=UPI00140DFA29|nr:hypothetical protein [Psychrobacillus vulpis]
MNNWLYSLFFIVLGLVSFITGEVVTFVMLGFIIISLNNIHITLKELLTVNKEKADTQ